ncbi:TAXI family TRAP transporter solute-binding subunit [Nocardia panacis]|uniref:TAXI family TRAP transporter solute-binding subunit n=1 Tax=Nocardia panacis TaxID=2340916 RepID=A0A3A4JY82_9NOCA|nr:TAXI family TRAP transporter solute-binding subunit [Nocardia panacis]RJO72123.1 TAXI family TRAP transporter solute-binding subunit [Nocardia panacis]
MLRRRGFLAAAGVAALAVAGCGSEGGAGRARVASGEVGGFYHAFAEKLAASAAQAGTVRIEVVTTAGSQDNLTMLARGEVDAALTLADSVARSGEPLVALGRVYENYLQMAVRNDSRIHTVGDLRGARVNLGAEGSGAALTGNRILSAAGLRPDEEVTVAHRPLRDSVAEVIAGTADALLWAGGVPTALFEVPNRMRLIDLGELATPMRELFGPVYDRVEIPAAAYPGATGVHTIGVTNLLLAARDMPNRTAAAIVDLLVNRAESLVPTEAAGAQFLDGRSLINTGAVPLHPGAVEVYRAWHG